MLDRASNRITPLKEQHQRILSQLEKISKTFRKPESSSAAYMQELLEGLGKQLRTHFADEEKSLYRPLMHKLARGGPIDQMINDHQSISLAFDLLLRLPSKRIGQSSEGPSLQSSIDSLREQLIEHLEKEEKVLFWLAEVRL